MIDFQKIDLSKKDLYNRYLMHCGDRGCEYSLSNLRMWGRQRVAFINDYLTIFSQFERSSVYPFPIGKGDVKPVLDALIQDARERGLECRFTALTPEDCATLEELYPGQFCYHPDRDGSNYVYSIDNLADLPGRKFQKKRNHLNRFRQNHPDCEFFPLEEKWMPGVEKVITAWYKARYDDNPHEYHMEQTALRRAFDHWEELGMEGLVMVEHGNVLALAIGSRLNEDTFDIHFEKALEDVDGAYAAINQAFAAHLREKYPQLRYLNREDDLGIPGLRKAKLSYYPDKLAVKFWANLWEDDDDH